MILAVPILIAISLFLGWVLIKLAVNALPFLAGMTAAFALYPLNDGIGAALIAGVMVAVAVSALGTVAFHSARSAGSRIALALLFAVPAAVAAWHIVQGIPGHLMAAGAGRDAAALMAALVVGGMAWRRLTERAASMGRA